jgi:hypothetical protein
MGLKDILFWVNVGLTLILIVRLIRLHLRGVFRLFLLFLLADLVVLCLTSAMKVEGSWIRYHLDYRVLYRVSGVVELAIMVCIVFALLRSIMLRFPGILKLSRRILATTVLLAAGLGLLLVAVQATLDKDAVDKARREEATKDRDAQKKEFEKANVAPPSAAKENQRFNSVFQALTVDQTVSTVLLLTLVVMLLFLLWFPVDVPRNTVIFSAGYIIFFAVKSLSLFFRYFSAGALPSINIAIQVVSAVCFSYWLVYLTRSGQVVPVRLGHRWKPQEQERLLSQLDAINATLLRSARQP